MAIEITSDSIVKVLIRRGTDSERQLTTLTEGELGYCIDTQRLFIGDGITTGGVVAGNKFLGFVGTPASYNSIAQDGDMVYQTSGLANAQRLVAYNKSTNNWLDVHPQPYIGYITNSIPCLEKSSQNGKWRVSRNFVDDSISPPSGLTIKYDDDIGPGSLNSITKLYNRLDFDSRFLSLCASVLPLSSSFYFGNYNTRAVRNNLDANVNVENSLFINGTVANAPYQIKMYAQDPRKSFVSTFEAVSGGLDIITGGGNNSLSNLPLTFYIGKNVGYQLRYNQSISTLQTIFSAAPNKGSYGIPNFDFRGGVAKFNDDVYLTPNADLTIYGNLSVFGDATYIDTAVTSTSALSVVNHNQNIVALFVAQQNNFADDQAIAIFKEGIIPSRPVLALRDSGFVGVNCLENENWTNNQVHFNVTGSSDFKDHPNYPSSNGTIFTVQNSSIRLGTSPTTQTITSYANNSITFTTPNLYVTGDVTAFYSSDVTLKTNINKIDNALDRVNKLRGVTFDWNELAEEKYSKVGREAGVIAQEVEAVLPEVVTTREDGTKAVRYEKLVPLLIEAIKELDKKYGKG